MQPRRHQPRVGQVAQHEEFTQYVYPNAASVIRDNEIRELEMRHFIVGVNRYDCVVLSFFIGDPAELHCLLGSVVGFDKETRIQLDSATNLRQSVLLLEVCAHRVFDLKAVWFRKPLRQDRPIDVKHDLRNESFQITSFSEKLSV